MKNLLPCPFCGSKTYGKYLDDLEVWIGGCSDNDCPVEWAVHDAKTEKELEERLNARVNNA